jgi:hypothetical protein
MKCSGVSVDVGVNFNAEALPNVRIAPKESAAPAKFIQIVYHKRVMRKTWAGCTSGRSAT